MTDARAFPNDSQRDTLLADIAEKGPVYSAWLTRASVTGDIDFVSADYGLDQAFAHILPAIGGFGEVEDATRFYNALLSAIPAGAETRSLARRILLLAWTDPDTGRATAVGGGPLRDACETIAALVRRSIDGTVDRRDWRAVRTALAGAPAQTDGEVRVADLMMSLAWDLDHAPGAAQDVLTAWSKAVTIETDEADPDRFTAEETKIFEAEMSRVSEEAMESLARTKSLDSIEVEEFLAEVERCWTAEPKRNALKLRSVALRGRTNARMAAWRAGVQRRVLDLAMASFDAQGSLEPATGPAQSGVRSLS